MNVMDEILALVESTPIGARISIKELKRFIKFSIVGTSGAVVDFSILNLMILVFGWPKIWANALSFSCAVLNNFTWNRLWTFPESKERKVHGQLAQFALVSITGLMINETIFLSLSRVLAPHFGNVIGYNLAKVIATLLVLVWNFNANRRFTYRGIE